MPKTGAGGLLRKPSGSPTLQVVQAVNMFCENGELHALGCALVAWGACMTFPLAMCLIMASASMY